VHDIVRALVCYRSEECFVSPNVQVGIIKKEITYFLIFQIVNLKIRHEYSYERVSKTKRKGTI